MTTSVGQALPGFAAARAPSAKSSADEKSDDKSFGKMVGGDEKPAAPEAPPATEAGVPGPRWTKRVLVGLGKAEPAPVEPGKAASPKLAAAKTAKHDPDSDKTSADTEESGQAATATPLQDHLPLLMALHDMRHFSTSAKTDARSATADNQTPDLALDCQASFRGTAARACEEIPRGIRCRCRRNGSPVAFRKRRGHGRPFRTN